MPSNSPAFRVQMDLARKAQAFQNSRLLSRELASSFHCPKMSTFADKTFFIEREPEFLILLPWLLFFLHLGHGETPGLTTLLQNNPVGSRHRKDWGQEQVLIFEQPGHPVFQFSHVSYTDSTMPLCRTATCRVVDTATRFCRPLLSLPMQHPNSPIPYPRHTLLWVLQRIEPGIASSEFIRHACSAVATLDKFQCF